MKKRFDSFFIWVWLGIILWSLLFWAGIAWGVVRAVRWLF
jgi:hypothetical protein